MAKRSTISGLASTRSGTTATPVCSAISSTTGPRAQQELHHGAHEFAVYSVLASGDGMTPTELAHWMAAPPTTVSSYVKRFEQRGHVRRVPNPDDRRSYRLQLTASGRRVHRSAGTLFQPVLDEVAERVGTGLTDTHRRLQELHGVVAALNGNDRDLRR